MTIDTLGRCAGASTLALALAFAACGDDSPASPDAAPPTGQATVTVTHYDYRFALATRAAHSTLTVTFDSAGDCFTLPMRAELVAGSVMIDGAPPRAATRGATTLEVCLELGREAGATVALDVDSTVALATVADSQVGYSVRNDPQQNPFSYLVSWVDGCDRFGPCDARSDRFATYTFHVTHPAEQMVRCSGVITEVSPTETTCDFTYAGGPTYSTFGFAAYPRAAWPRSTQTWGHVAVELHAPALSTIPTNIDASYHAGFLTMMEANFGPYPYGDAMRLLVAPTYWNGFEHPGNIVLDDSLRTTPPLGGGYANPLAHTLDHEIAHMWAGDETTLATTHDFVWKEAMAEYLTYIYEDSVGTGLNTAAAWKSYSVGAQYFPVPGEKPALFDYYGDVYGPGPMILFRQIEAMSSRQAVIDALKMVLGTQRALSVAEVVAALEATTGLELDAYAAAWINGTGAPVWPRVTANLDDTTLHVVQTVAPERRCKFHVALRGDALTDRLLVPVDTFKDGIDQTITVALPAFAVTSIEIDPLRECLITQASGIQTSANAEDPMPLHVNPWLAPN